MASFPKNRLGRFLLAQQVLSLNYRALPEDAVLCNCGVEEQHVVFEGQIAHLIIQLSSDQFVLLKCRLLETSSSWMKIGYPERRFHLPTIVQLDDSLT